MSPVSVVVPLIDCENPPGPFSVSAAAVPAGRPFTVTVSAPVAIAYRTAACVSAFEAMETSCAAGDGDQLAGLGERGGLAGEREGALAERGDLERAALVSRGRFYTLADADRLPRELPELPRVTLNQPQARTRAEYCDLVAKLGDQLLRPLR